MSAQRMTVADSRSPELLVGAKVIADFLFPNDPVGRQRIYNLLKPTRTPRIPVFHIGRDLAARPTALLAWVAECEAAEVAR